MMPIPERGGKRSGAKQVRPVSGLGPWVGARTTLRAMPGGARSPPLPSPPPRSFLILRCVGRRGNRLVGSRSLPVGFPPFSCFFQFAILFGEDLFVPAFGFCQRRDITNPTVQADCVVMPDVILDEPSRCRMISTSGSFIASRISQCTIDRLQPSRMLHL